MVNNRIWEESLDIPDHDLEHDSVPLGDSTVPRQYEVSPTKYWNLRTTHRSFKPSQLREIPVTLTLAFTCILVHFLLT